MRYEVRGFDQAVLGVIETDDAMALMQALQRMQCSIEPCNTCLERPVTDVLGTPPVQVHRVATNNRKKQRRKGSRVDVT